MLSVAVYVTVMVSPALPVKRLVASYFPAPSAVSTVPKLMTNVLPRSCPYWMMHEEVTSVPPISTFTLSLSRVRPSLSVSWIANWYPFVYPLTSGTMEVRVNGRESPTLALAWLKDPLTTFWMVG